MTPQQPDASDPAKATDARVAELVAQLVDARLAAFGEQVTAFTDQLSQQMTDLDKRVSALEPAEQPYRGPDLAEALQRNRAEQDAQTAARTAGREHFHRAVTAVLAAWTDVEAVPEPQLQYGTRVQVIDDAVLQQAESAVTVLQEAVSAWRPIGAREVHFEGPTRAAALAVLDAWRGRGATSETRDGGAVQVLEDRAFHRLEWAMVALREAVAADPGMRNV